jgi:hypothetical protein
MSILVNISLTGDCQNLSIGAASLNAVSNPFQNTSPFFYDWVIPSLGTGDTKTGLSAGTYVVRVNDSTTPNNNEVYVNVNVSSGICSSIISTTNTSCGLNNGFLTVTADTTGQEILFSLYSGNTLYSTQTGLGSTSFVNLSSGIYSVVATDSGGCTAQTQNIVIGDSELFDFGFFVVPDSPCLLGSGKIFITGLTSGETYNYVWLNSQNNVLLQTGSTITGLTSDVYTVTITSNNNCTRSRSINLPLVNELGGLFTTTVSPSCFSSDGEITFNVTGGTGPFYYSGSNGTTIVSYSNTYTFTGLSAGGFSVSVTDISLCNFTTSTTLLTPNTFIITSINVDNSTCNGSDGSVTINLNGGTTPYTYTLSGSSGVENVITNSTTQIFNELEGGIYTLIISGGSSPCVYTQNLEILSLSEFSIGTQSTGTTCGQNNGYVEVIKTSGGTSPYLYQLTGPQNLSILSLDNSVLFSGLQPGIYQVIITTNDGCVSTNEVFVPEQPPLNFTLFPTNCGFGNEGTITAIITSGTPPFTLNWFPSISNGIYATGLTAGDYSLEIIDGNGCSDIKNVEIECSTQYTSYNIFNICKNYMDYSYGNKFGLIEMLNFGFQDITSGDTTCVLNSAEFIVTVTANTIVTSTTVYTGINLIDVPNDDLLYNRVKQLLSGISGIGGVTIDYNSNSINIFSDCSLNNTLDDIGIKIELMIIYDITCNDD